MKVLNPDDPEHVCLWVDAICINQFDAAEKSAQVKMIGQIFAQADEVVAWLGDLTPERERALAFITGLKNYFDMHYAQNAAEDVSSAMELNPYRKVMPADDLVALSKLMGHPYFSRTWIVQEVAVARKLQLLIGHHTLSWEVFAEVCERVFRHPNIFLGLSLPQDILLVQHTRQLYQTWRLLLLEVMLLTLNFKSQDPRDKIFAIVGICASENGTVVEPDYMQRTEDLFHSVAISHLRNGHINLLLGNVTPTSKH